MNEQTIWGERQDHPELVIQDCRELLGLNENQCDVVRWILLRRGVNKWLYNRWLFIQLKHRVKELLKSFIPGTPEYKLIGKIYEPMQHIAKNPRWIEWGQHIHKKMSNNIAEIIIRGKST